MHINKKQTPVSTKKLSTEGIEVSRLDVNPGFHMVQLSRLMQPVFILINLLFLTNTLSGLLVHVLREVSQLGREEMLTHFS